MDGLAANEAGPWSNEKADQVRDVLWNAQPPEGDRGGIRRLGLPRYAILHLLEVKELGIGRASVYRILAAG